MIEYPSGLDMEWVAVDRQGRMGIFTTAGCGPIPTAYLASSEVLDQLSGAVWSLPEITEHELLVSLPRPDDFIACARRGLYAFDWADVHRSEGQAKRYKVYARPKKPLMADSIAWSPELRALLEQVTSRNLDFDEAAVDVVSALACAIQPAALR